MTRPGLVIAIDGPGGVGKTTVSRALARRLGLRHVCTGAMYRALALAADESGIDAGDEDALRAFCAGIEIEYDCASGRVGINGKDYTERVGSQRAGELASVVSAAPPVREFLVACQKRLARGGGVVMEGRDIGTVVCPDADLKFFLDAPLEVRARRRRTELGTDSGEVDEKMRKRDKLDRERAASPMRPAPDAVSVDTAEMDADAVVDHLLSVIAALKGS